MDSKPSDRPAPRPSDALGTLRVRSQGSRTIVILVAVVGIIGAALVLGMIWRAVTGGIQNAPTIPSVGKL